MTRKKRPIAKPSSSGFTIVETAVVIFLAAFMLVAGIVLVRTWTAQSTQTANQQRLNAIQQALTNYASPQTHNRLPCPASFTAATTSTAFGRESTSCTGPLVAGTYAATGRTAPGVANSAVIIGALPVRDLGLPDSYAVDTYGHMYTYAVTESETSTTTPLNALAGVIDVGDGSGNSILPYASDGVTRGTALYVVVNHGSDGKGAYLENSAAPAISCGTAANGLDFYNCNYTLSALASIQFRNAPFSMQPGPNWFDDMLVYGTAPSTARITTPQTCKVIKMNNSAAAGVNTGHYQTGSDSGAGASQGFVAINYFQFGNTINNIVIAADYADSSSPTADAYCPGATYHVVSGGCTQTTVAPVLPNAATGSVASPFGGDIVVDKLQFDLNNINTKIYNNSAFAGAIQGFSYQAALSPLSHPTLNPATGIQGWECNGSSASGMYTQAYAVCCQ
jgi:type II secretory pathway pseudopilin PulG